MAEREIIEALTECLEALRSGDADLQACLDRYPAYRGELESLLEVAQLISQLSLHVQPSASFRERTRRRIQDLPNGGSSPTAWDFNHHPFS